MAAAAISGDPVRVSAESARRVLVVLIPLGFVAGALLVVAGPELAQFLRAGHVAALLTLVVGAVAARAVRVDLVGVTPGKISFEFAVVLSAAVLYGLAVAVFVAIVAELAVQLIDRPPLLIVGVYNDISAILQAGAAGMVAGILRGSGRPADVMVATVGASVAWIAVNVVLCGAAISRSSSLSVLPVLKQGVHVVRVPALFMTSVVALIVVAWRQSPPLALAAIGPMAAIALLEVRRVQVATANTLALTDALTGLGNRRHFDERLARELERSKRLGTAFSLCLVDIDDFKRINDTYGHSAGDEVLSATASCLRGNGEAFRCGGDEFALLLPGCAEAEAERAATAIRGRIGELADPGGLPLAASAGTATLSSGSSTQAGLLRAADESLYARKEAKCRLPSRERERD